MRPCPSDQASECEQRGHISSNLLTGIKSCTGRIRPVPNLIILIQDQNKARVACGPCLIMYGSDTPRTWSCTGRIRPVHEFTQFDPLRIKLTKMPLKCPKNPLNLKITYVLFLSQFCQLFPKNNVPEHFAQNPTISGFWPKNDPKSDLFSGSWKDLPRPRQNLHIVPPWRRLQASACASAEDRKISFRNFAQAPWRTPRYGRTTCSFWPNSLKTWAGPGPGQNDLKFTPDPCLISRVSAKFRPKMTQFWVVFGLEILAVDQWATTNENSIIFIKTTRSTAICENRKFAIFAKHRPSQPCSHTLEGGHFWPFLAPTLLTSKIRVTGPRGLLSP